MPDGPSPDSGADVPAILDALVRGRLHPRLHEELLAAFGVDLSDTGAAPSRVFVRDDPVVAGIRLAGWLADLLRRRGATLAAVTPAPDVDPAELPTLDWRPPHPPPSEEALARFLRWLDEQGAELPALQVVTSPGGRGVHARRAIEPDERILHVPRELLLSDGVARASPIGRAIDDAAVRLADEHSRLAAWLAVERRDPRSPWRPYLDVLPADFPTLPATFSRDELAELRGTLALRRVDVQLRSLLADHTALTALPAFQRLSFHEFVWARLAVATRVFSITVDGAETHALIPMADLLNHHGERETTFGRKDAAAGFDIHALRPFAAGQEVRDSYGAKCNSRFAAHYGFFVADNPHDEAAVDLSPPRDDARAALAARLVWGHPLIAARPFHVGAGHDHEWTERALRFLRLVCADDAELAAVERAADLAHLGPRNEQAALAAFAGAARHSLARFPTSIAADDALLADPALSPRLRLCVLVRRAEKRVLAALTDMQAR